VKRSADGDGWSFGVVTVTSTVPVPTGSTATIPVDESTVKLVALFDPKVEPLWLR